MALKGNLQKNKEKRQLLSWGKQIFYDLKRTILLVSYATQITVPYFTIPTKKHQSELSETSPPLYNPHKLQRELCVKCVPRVLSEVGSDGRDHSRW